MQIVDADGPFASQGVRPGFIILGINQTRVASPDDVRTLATRILKADSRERVMFISGFYPGGRQAFYAIDLCRTRRDIRRFVTEHCPGCAEKIDAITDRIADEIEAVKK